MAKLKLIARYADGRMVKGHTENFNPNAATFNIQPIDHVAENVTSTLVHMKQLKAVFVVKSFEGKAYDPEKAGDACMKDLKERFVVKKIENEEDNAAPKNKPAIPPTAGLVMNVTFNDGEVMTGSTMTYDPSAIGFFIFPLDPESNNDRVFVINENVAKVEQVNMSRAG